jgi:2-polyprenyl-6-hydroxyphenyl methylase/3-demethylubiquinone-9 3-methyltransferase
MSNQASAKVGAPQPGAFDHSTHEEFFEYYAHESASEEALGRFRRIRDHILRVMEAGKRKLEVADIGCGAGTQSVVWAEQGHNVRALDVNAPLVALARERAQQRGYSIDFRVGSATNVPWGGEQVDVCIANELLEHVVDWRSCINEFTRILRPGGVLFFTTTNWLCPRQAEFNLPLYSWYPPPLKRRYEALSLTTKPELANFAKYPAVHWFSFYQFRRLLNPQFRCLDRFDIMDLSNKSAAAHLLVTAIRALPPLRWAGQVCTAGTVVLAIKIGHHG